MELSFNSALISRNKGNECFFVANVQGFVQVGK
jgi:hypothetical protein